MKYFTILFERLTSTTPLFFKKIIAFGVTLGGIGASIMLAGDQLPPWLVDQADNMIIIGTVAAIIAKATTTDTDLSRKQ